MKNLSKGVGGRLGALFLCLSLVTCFAACGDSSEDERCGGVEAELQPSGALNFGQMYPDSDERDVPGSSDRAPREQAVLINSNCQDDVKITNACMIGSNDYFVELVPGETFPLSATTGSPAAIRVNYYPEGGAAAKDDALLIIESNAGNFSIPVCAQVVEEGAEKTEIECDPPAEAACP